MIGIDRLIDVVFIASTPENGHPKSASQWIVALAAALLPHGSPIVKRQTLASFAILFTTLLIHPTAEGSEYHVAVDGNDALSGTANEPWQTFARAMNSMEAGDTLWIHAGTYHEPLEVTVSGSRSEGAITIQAAEGDSVTIDGQDLTVTDQLALITIKQQSHVTVRGLTVRNLSTRQRSAVPIGILIQGSGEQIKIEACTVHQIASLAEVNRQRLGRDAHGIAVYGDGEEPLTDVTLSGNRLFDLTLGSSEALVVNGNVEGFEIRENLVHDCDNIGIDCIGFEGVSPREATDQARQGIVCDNHVFNVTTESNPAYGGERSAGGIYVDGGRDIIVERNQVDHCDFGIEVASEHRDRATSNIVVRNNLLRDNLQAGLIIGGYARRTTGSAEDCLIVNNTFYNNDTILDGDEWGQLHLQYRVRRCTFANNIFYCDLEKADGYNIMIVQWNQSGGQNRFDFNQFYGSTTPVWVLGDQWLENWDAYQAHEFSGGNDRFGDPHLIETEQHALTLSEQSPAIDSGSDQWLTDDQRDLTGHPRLDGEQVDRGAVEFRFSEESP